MPKQDEKHFNQNHVIAVMDALGYAVNEKGICHGLSLAAQQASFIKRGLSVFQARLRTIHEIHLQYPDLDVYKTIIVKKKALLAPNIIDKAKISHPFFTAKKRDDVFNALELKRINDLYAFFDTLSVLQDPQGYRHLFEGNHYIRQSSFIAQHLMCPVELEAHPRQTILSVMGAYTLKELKHSLTHMKACFSNQTFSVLVQTLTHCIHLSYHPESHRWFYFDPNDLPGFFASDIDQVIDVFKPHFSFSKYRALSIKLVSCIKDEVILKEALEAFNHLYRPIKNRVNKRLNVKDDITAFVFLLATQMGNFDLVDIIRTQFTQIKKSKLPLWMQLLSIHPDKTSSLAIACQNGHLDLVRFMYEELLRCGALITQLNAKDRNGITPLHIACQNGHFNIVRYLIERLIHKTTLLNELNPEDSKGITPFYLACQNGHKKVMLYLLNTLIAQGMTLSELNTPSHAGVPPLLAACYHHQERFVYALLKRLSELGASVEQLNPADIKGTTLLHLGCQLEDRGLFEYILQTLVDKKVSLEELNPADHEGFTPLHLICQHRDLERLKSHFSHLLAHKINNRSLNPQNHLGYTPMHVACYSGFIEGVRFLSSELHKAGLTHEMIHAASFSGETPYDIARQAGHVDIALYLAQPSFKPPSLYGFLHQKWSLNDSNVERLSPKESITPSFR